jgi:hypothetical protein
MTRAAWIAQQHGRKAVLYVELTDNLIVCATF